MCERFVDYSLEDFKAAFISVNKSSMGCLKSQKKLLKALQICGKNPNENLIKKYWDEYTYIDIDLFCEIASKEKETSEIDILKAFKLIDTNKDGFITAKDFVNIFSNQGDELHKEELKKLLEEADIDKHQNLNYKEFAQLIMNTIEKTKINSKKIMELITVVENEIGTLKKHRDTMKSDFFISNSTEINTSGSGERIIFNRNKEKNYKNDYDKEKFTNLIIHDSHLSLIKKQLSDKNEDQEFNLKNIYSKWLRKSIKGCFYFNEVIGKVIGNSFALDLDNNSTLFFTIETFKSEHHSKHVFDHMDASLFIIKDDEELTVKGYTETFIKNKFCAKVYLTPGRYFLFPFTTGCCLKKRSNDHSINKAELYKRDLKGKISLSSKFRDALNVAFDMVDLDSNGKLSQDEMNLYTFITSNEDIPVKEWEFLGDLVGFEKNELTKKSFIKLHQIEANQKDSDLNDIISRLSNLGFNSSLKIDQSCPFIINVFSEKSEFDLLLSEIYEVKKSERFLKEILETKAFSHSIKELPNVNLLIQRYKNWSVILIQNMSRKNINLEIDCSESQNCVSITNDLISFIHIKSKKTKVAMYLLNLDSKKDIDIRCKPKIID